MVHSSMIFSFHRTIIPTIQFAIRRHPPPLSGHQHAMTDSSEDWRNRAHIVKLIKEICFDSGVIDPRNQFNKSKILAARSEHPHFDIEENLWYLLFRRAASEYNLQEDQDAVGANSRHHQSSIAFTPLTSTPTRPKALHISKQHHPASYSERTKVSVVHHGMLLLSIVSDS